MVLIGRVGDQGIIHLNTMEMDWHYLGFLTVNKNRISFLDSFIKP